MKLGSLFSQFGINNDIESFAKLLYSPLAISEKGILFIFDNFETMADVKGLHKFLDEHTHLPNKVLITSREERLKLIIQLKFLVWNMRKPNKC